MNRTLMN